MRLLLINYEYPPLGGGAGNATAHLAREFAAMGHQVEVMTSRFDDLPHQEKINGYTVIRIPTWRRDADRSNPLEMLIFLLSSMIYVWRWRGKIDYTIAFFGIPGAPAAYVLKLISGVPYIVSLRGGDVPGFQPYDLKNFHRLTRPIIKFLWSQAAHVVANSQGLADLAQESAPKRTIPIIPNGIDTERFIPSKTPLPMGKWLFVGRIAQQKGLTYLIKAVALLPESLREKLCITIVGDGPLRSSLENEADQAGVRAQFNFVGWVPRDQMISQYQQHSGFIFPSLDEGMSNAVLEAMACGLPIIATNIAGNNELVQDNGWLVEPANSADLAEKLALGLRDHQQLIAIGQRSRQIAEGYNWRLAAEKYLNLMAERQGVYAD